MSDDKIWGLGQDHRVTRQGEIRINCPICPTKGRGEDTKYHCYVNLEKRVFNCYRCKTAGPLGRLKGFAESALTSVRSNLNDIRSKLAGMLKVKAVPKFDLDLMSWPINSGDAPIGYKYMLERGFTDEEMEKYSLRVGKNYKDPKTGDIVKRWAGRVLFPFYENGEVVFIVGRDYKGKDPKYINSFGSKDHVVYGIDRVVDRSCILCEGIISAIAAERTTGMPAISILGKTATKWQLSKIRNKADRVFVALDGTEDVTERDRKSLNRALLKLGVDVFEVILPKGKDPDDAGQEFQRCFERASRVRL